MRAYANRANPILQKLTVVLLIWPAIVYGCGQLLIRNLGH